jgi:hypothetical protein
MSPGRRHDEDDRVEGALAWGPELPNH